jgi:hypothetical protein
MTRSGQASRGVSVVCRYTGLQGVQERHLVVQLARHGFPVSTETDSGLFNISPGPEAHAEVVGKEERLPGVYAWEMVGEICLGACK